MGRLGSTAARLKASQEFVGTRKLKGKKVKFIKWFYFPLIGGGALQGVDVAVQLDTTPGTSPGKTAE